MVSAARSAKNAVEGKEVIRSGIFWILMLLCLAGATSRFYGLADMDTRADEVELLRVMQSDVSVRDYLSREVAAFRAGRQMPLPRFATAAFVRCFNLIPTLSAIRTPYAVMGVLCVPAFWLLGMAWEGRKTAVVLAFLAAVNPYMIFWSKVAHVYAFPMCLFTFSAAFFAASVRDVRRDNSPGKGAIAWFSVSSILACYSHMSVWPAVALLWVSLAVYMRARRESRSAAWARVGLGFGAWALSLVPWVLIFVSALFTARGSFLPPDADIPTQFKHLAAIPLAMTWGGGWRTAFSLGLPAAAVVAGLADRGERARILFVCLSCLMVFLILLAMQYAAAKSFDSVRYYTPVWTGLMLLSGLGLLAVGRAIGRAPLLRRVGEAGGTALACAALAAAVARPVVLTMTLPAPSIPYTMINRWMDANLPKGTPVLVDRWLEPWNEMLYHAPSNVIVTFTIPDEPVETYMRYQWRDTAVDFFKKYPDAAYLELVKHYFHVPAVGYWNWPREHFRRRHVFTNEQALALAQISMMPDPVAVFPGSNTNRLVVELFYDTPQDVINGARENGEKVLFLYGEGWGYTKLWRQVQGDFRDWRVVEKEAVVEIYNLTDLPLDVKVDIEAAAVPSAKQIKSSSGSSFRFDAQRITAWDFIIKSIPPGRYRLLLRDPIWTTSRSALLVSRLEMGIADEKQ